MKETPKLDERFITKIKGKDFVKYPGLLDLGHKIGISKIDVTPLQFPTKENGKLAICQAEVVSKAGETFKDIGDADPNNCDTLVAKHVLRMASTRAIARALRSFTNIGMTCLEEIDDFSSLDGGTVKKTTKAKPTKKTTPKKDEPKAAKPKQDAEKSKSGKKSDNTKTSSGTPTMSPAQHKAIQNLAKRRGIGNEELDQMCVEAYGVILEKLPSSDASAFIRTLQSK